MSGRVDRVCFSRLRLVPLIVGWATLIAGCYGRLDQPGLMLSGSGSGGDLLLPVASMEQRRFASVIRQRYDFSCGSAALATLLTYHYGDPQSEESVFIGMWRDGDRAQIRRLGFSLLDMKRYLAARNLKADGFKVSLDQVAKAGVPGIALIDTRGYKHFVIVKGVTSDAVLVGDPALGIRSIGRDEFTRTWNGIFFVINEKTEVARHAFNTAAEWSLIPRARVGFDVEPVSVQALALSAPFLLTDF